jgi:hypothetical protein
LARPGEGDAVVLVARHHVHVEVEHGLPAQRAVGLQQRQARRVKHRADGLGHALRRLHDGGSLFGREVEQRDRMALGGHQHMPRGDLAQVHESDGQRILVHPGCRNLACHQAAENALAGGRCIDEHGHGLSPFGWF